MKKRACIVLGIILVLVAGFAIYYAYREYAQDEHEKAGNENEEKVDIRSLDDFYNTELAKDKDIRNLPEDYSSFDAQEDNCFVIGAMVHNDYLYGEFMENCKNKKPAFIRVGQNTTEGDLVLFDILYDETADTLYLVADSTRDKFSAKQDRIIQMREFAHVAEYEKDNSLYWVLYNEPITDENFETDNVFLLAIIN